MGLWHCWPAGGPAAPRPAGVRVALLLLGGASVVVVAGQALA
jgi:hypothetical protein